MNEDFYKRCKKVVAKLELSYEQGIARDVILNELDMLEKQAIDYQKRFSKAIEYIERYLRLNLEAFDTKDLLEKILEILDKESEK